MDKLFVITYKRPAVTLEKITLNVEEVYDSEIATSEELAEIIFKDKQSKYEDVDMFKCEPYLYLEFVKDEKSFFHFAKTGEHWIKPLDDLDEGYQPPYALWVLDGDDNKWKPWGGRDSEEFDKDDFLAKANKREFPNGVYLNNYIDAIIRPNDGKSPEDDIKEDIEVGVEQHTISIPLILEMKKYQPDTSFDYAVDIDDVGQIVFTPLDSGTSFINIERNIDNSNLEIIEDDKKVFTINLTANLLSEDGNYEYFMGLDDVGQAVITPDSEKTSFLSGSVDNSLNLITDSPLSEEIQLSDSAEEDNEPKINNKPEDKSEENKPLEVEVKIVNEETDTDGPYSKEQIESELKSITDNFTLKSGDIKCGYEEEHYHAMEILSKYYECESGKEGSWLTIKFWKENGLNEEFDLKDLNDTLKIITELDKRLKEDLMLLQDLYDNLQDLALDQDEISLIVNPISGFVNGTPGNDFNLPTLKRQIEDLIKASEE